MEKIMKVVQLLFLIAVLSVLFHQPLFAADQRFSVQADKSLLIDNETGLMWPVQDNGSDISWPAGKEYCEKLTLAGFKDWRMPTQEELATLYNLKAADSSDYYIILEIKVTACCLWAIDTKKAKVGSFDFEYGNRDWGYPMSTVDARVLPVRNIK